MKTDNYVSTIVEAKFKVKLTTADTQNFGTKTTRFFFFSFSSLGLLCDVVSQFQWVAARVSPREREEKESQLVLLAYY